MPSVYKSKQAKPITKQMPPLKELAIYVDSLPKAVCTNCGATNHDNTNRFSKCYCGGTFQTYKA